MRSWLGFRLLHRLVIEVDLHGAHTFGQTIVRAARHHAIGVVVVLMWQRQSRQGQRCLLREVNIFVRLPLHLTIITDHLSIAIFGANFDFICKLRFDVNDRLLLVEFLLQTHRGHRLEEGAEEAAHKQDARNDAHGAAPAEGNDEVLDERTHYGRAWSHNKPRVVNLHSYHPNLTNARATNSDSRCESSLAFKIRSDTICAKNGKQNKSLIIQSPSK